MNARNKSQRKTLPIPTSVHVELAIHDTQGPSTQSPPNVASHPPLRRFLGSLLLVAALVAACYAPAVQPPSMPPISSAVTAPAPLAAEAGEIGALAEQAYVFAYPMLENYKTMTINAIDTQSQSYRAPFNQLYHFTELGGPQKTDVVRTNNDTLNSIAWLDLRAEPMVISVPEMPDRYYTFQLVDMYTFNFAYIGTRATGTGAGNYMVASPAWQGDIPAGINGVFQSEGNFVYSLTRTEVDGEEDLQNAQAIQQQYKVQPLSAFLGQPAPPAAPALHFPPFDQAEAQSAGFIEYFNFLLGQVTIDPSEKDLIDSFGRLGVGPNRPFDAEALDPAMRAAIDAGVAIALKTIELEGARLGEHQNGWVLPGQIFGTREEMDGRYLTRAAAAYWGLYGNSLEEAYYPTTKIDPAGNPLDASKNRYVLVFSQEQIPQVNAFWSLTMYDADQMMVANPMNRYSIGDRTEGLQYGADGSLEIYLQSDSPGKDKESNWLPAPDGLFSLTLRMYLPQDSALNPLYAPPGIQKLDSSSTKLTARMLTQPNSLAGPSPSSFNWSPIGATLVYVEPQEGQDMLWLYDAASGEKRLLLDPAGSEANIDVTSAQWSPDGNRLLLTGDDAFWLLDAATGELAQVAAGGGNATSVVFTPDGARVSYVQDNDLYVLDIDSGDVQRLTNDGGETVFNGNLDWVYTEELATRAAQPAYAWSPDVFRCGVAGAAPTDWSYYDTIYTERYMRTPEANPEGYAATNLIDMAGQIEARPLLIHGLADTNVHLQNTVNFIQALEAQDKLFNFVPLPNLSHSFRGDGLVAALSASADYLSACLE